MRKAGVVEGKLTKPVFLVVCRTEVLWCQARAPGDFPRDVSVRNRFCVTSLHTVVGKDLRPTTTY